MCLFSWGVNLTLAKQDVCMHVATVAVAVAVAVSERTARGKGSVCVHARPYVHAGRSSPGEQR